MHQGAAQPVTATGRVVVVTGASSGIGRATAIQLSRSGSVVVLASRSESALLAAQQDCAPGMTTVVPTDVSRRHEVDALMDEAIRVHGRVDAVVHAAAVLAYGRFEDVAGRGLRQRPADHARRYRQRGPLGSAGVRGSGWGQSRRRGLAARQDRHALHELVPHRQVGGARAGAMPADRGPDDVRDRHQPGHTGRGQHPRLPPGRYVRATPRAAAATGRLARTGCATPSSDGSTGRPARPTSVPPTRSRCSGSVSSQGFSTASSLR